MASCCGDGDANLDGVSQTIVFTPILVLTSEQLKKLVNG
jgi:hypothetical protein